MEYNKVVYNPAAGGVKFHPNPPRTPNLNAMAASPNSIVFERFYAGSGVWYASAHPYYPSHCLMLQANEPY